MSSAMPISAVMRAGVKGFPLRMSSLKAVNVWKWAYTENPIIIITKART